MAYESKSYELLRYMAKKQGSHRNQLGQQWIHSKVKENRHPISLYRAFGFPL
jgi:adenosine deaminase/adenosine deaminase CECR1